MVSTYAWLCEFCTIEAQMTCSDKVCRALCADHPIVAKGDE